MCTVSWWIDPADNCRYHLFFNRDESKTRGIALPPTPRETTTGTSFLSPTDTNAGGTWLLVNQWGLTLGVLNHYPREALNAPATPISRGQLLLSLADAPDLASLATRWQELDCHPYRAFILVALAPGEPPQQGIWDGERSQWLPLGPPPLTTSSFHSEAICQKRHQFFDQHSPLSPSKLETLHHTHWPRDGASSILMHRPEARTVSVSHLTIDRTQAVYHYRAVTESPPPRLEPPEICSLSLSPKTTL